MVSRIKAGDKFGRLEVESSAGSMITPAGYRRKFWNCKCKCGNTAIVQTSNLMSGNTQSCGCNKYGHRRTHGNTPKSGWTPEYRALVCAIQRCHNPNVKGYKGYGGRGIIVCNEWRENPKAFLNYIGKRPSPQHQLDRYPDNDGNYEPGNVRWATRKEQCRNRRSNRWITLDGITRTLAEWAEVLSLPYSWLQKTPVEQWKTDRLTEVPVGDWKRK